MTIRKIESCPPRSYVVGPQTWASHRATPLPLPPGKRDEATNKPLRSWRWNGHCWKKLTIALVYEAWIRPATRRRDNSQDNEYATKGLNDFGLANLR